MQYYMDLDGEFIQSEEYQPANGKEPCGEPIFNIHRGKTDWEIWVSILPPFHGDRDQTLSALIRYFEKNHAYRSGQLQLPRTYLHINGYDVPTEEEFQTMQQALHEGIYNWTPLARTGDPLIFFDYRPEGLTEAAGYQALAEAKAEFTIVHAHGHRGAVGQLTLPWIEENPLSTFFFMAYSCHGGDLDTKHVILNSILYDPQSLVLMAAGNTHKGSNLGENEHGPDATNLASDLVEGKSIGQAILNHVNVPFTGNSKMYPDLILSTKVFLGDLTLTIQP